MKELIEGIYNFLVANAASNLCVGIGDRYHHRQAPQSSAAPFLIYRVMDGSPEEYFSQNPMHEIREVQFNIISEDETTEEVSQLERYLMDLMDDAAIVVAGYTLLKFQRMINVHLDPQDYESEAKQQVVVTYEATMEKD